MMEYSADLDKSLLSQTPTKIRLNKEYKFFVRLDDWGNGLGKFHPIVEIFIDENNRLVSRYKTKDKSEGAQPYGYAVIGTLLEQQKEEIV
jgi:hypothetical protein